MTDPANSLKALTDLRDAGLITEEEFQAKRTIVLGRIVPSSATPVPAPHDPSERPSPPTEQLGLTSHFISPIGSPHNVPARSGRISRLQSGWRSVRSHARLAAVGLVLVALVAIGLGTRGAPTAASPTASPGVAAASRTFTLTSPSDGSSVSVGLLVVAGLGRANSVVTFDSNSGPPLSTTASSLGTWSIGVSLKIGRNELHFHDDAGATASITVTYVAPPPVVPTEAPLPTIVPTVEPTPEPTPEVTPAPIVYASLTSRQWAKVMKDPDAYLGSTYKVWACITQFDAATGADSFRAQGSYRNETYWYTNGTNVLFTGNEDALADYVANDVVFMRVTSLGSSTYQTTLGGSTTVPLFEVDTIQAKGSCA